MGQSQLIKALIDDFEANAPRLASLSDAELIEVTTALAETTSGIIGTLSGQVLWTVPDLVLKRGPQMVPLLEREAGKMLKDSEAPADLAILFVGPLARLLSNDGKVLDPSFDALLLRVARWRSFELATWIDALPLDRRLPLVRPVLIANQGRSGMPAPLLAACPVPEVITWSVKTVAAWKRDRDEMKKQSAFASIETMSRGFAAGAVDVVMTELAANLGPYRAPFLRGLGSSSGPSAIRFLVEELAGKPEDVRAAEEALRELFVRFDDAVITALKSAEKGKRPKLRAAAYRVRSTLASSVESEGAGVSSGKYSDPSERLTALWGEVSKERVDAVVSFYQKAEYRPPFPWEDLKGDEPALLLGLIVWGRTFFPIQVSIGGEWFERRWRDPFAFLGRESGEVSALAPWAATEALLSIKQHEVTKVTLAAYVNAFGARGDEPLAARMRDTKLVGRQHLLRHLASVSVTRFLDLFLEGAADKAKAVSTVCVPVIDRLGEPEREALEALLLSTKKSVREGAKKAIERIG